MMVKSKILERRVFSRKNLETNVIFEDEFGDQLFYVKSCDISLGGLFLATSIPVRIGTLLFLSLILPPHKRSIRLTGEVIRVTKPDASSVRGMGIRFVGLSDIARQRIAEFLAEK